MEFKAEISKVLKRYKAFWSYDEVDDRPVVQINIPLKTDEQKVSVGASLDKILSYYEEVFKERQELLDDTIPIISTFRFFGHTLLPSLLGAPVSFGGGSFWSEPILEDLEDFRDLQINWQCDNYRTFQDFCTHFSEKAKNRFCVPQHLAKSPGELMCSLRDPEKLIFDAYDRPDLVREFGQKCLSLSVEYSKRIIEHVELTEIGDGHIYCYSNWIPRDTVCFSEDYTSIWSPQFYDEFVRPLDVSFIKSFAVSNMEWHSGCFHIFANMPKVDAIEFNLDPIHSSIIDVFPDLTPYVGTSKILIPCKKMEVKTVIDTFGVKGLMLVTHCETVNEGNRLLENIIEWTQEYKDKRLKHRQK